MTVVSFACMLVLVATHIAGQRFYRQQWLSREHWRSLGGGAAVAFVFVEMLPQLAHWEARTKRDALSGIELPSLHLLALAGILVFYSLEWLAVQRQRVEEREKPIFTAHLLIFALYNLLIGYLLVREIDDLAGMVMYTLALAGHMITNDHALREHHAARYDRWGRMLLAGAVFIGWVLGSVLRLPEPFTALCFALLVGSIIVNVLKEELPGERQGELKSFVASAAVFTVLLALF